jgi:iron-sulfur cluster assembly protein
MELKQPLPIIKVSRRKLKVKTMTRMPLTLTNSAFERVKSLLAQRGKPSIGIRISIRTKGCSGLSYSLEYADAKDPLDEIMEINGVTILIDPKAVIFILGTEMDYVE